MSHPAKTDEELLYTFYAHVLVVARQTATSSGLLEAVRKRAEHGEVTFHLLVPGQPRDKHNVVDPREAGPDEARQMLDVALPKLSEAASQEVTGSVGDSEPLVAIENAIHLGDYDEIIISTLPLGLSRWLKLDVVSKARRLGLPVTHVEAASKIEAGAVAA
jgi:GABA permease